MDADEQQAIIELYKERLREYGPTSRVLGQPEAHQRLRFQILLSEWGVSTGQSLLDVGCGFGDLYGYCTDHGYRAAYHGIDMCSELVEEARTRFPEGSFEVGDILADERERSFDYVIASGVHSYRLNDNWGFVEDTFELFSRIAKVGFAVNFLSDRVVPWWDKLFYADPSRVLQIAYRHSTRVVLRNDYMPFEFTVFVDKRTATDRAYMVYSDRLDEVRQHGSGLPLFERAGLVGRAGRDGRAAASKGVADEPSVPL